MKAKSGDDQLIIVKRRNGEHATPAVKIQNVRSFGHRSKNKQVKQLLTSSIISRLEIL